MECAMIENKEEPFNESIEELMEFYARKKNEQEALRKLLEALEVKTKNDNTTNGVDKN
jgi:hypothetical protein